MLENEHNSQNYEIVKNQHFVGMTEDLSRRKPFLSYNDVISMNSASASNSVSSIRKSQAGESNISDKIFGSMRSESHSPTMTSSTEKNWLAIQDNRAERLERQGFLRVECLHD